MVTYNPRAVAFGLLFGELEWLDSGMIQMTWQVQVKQWSSPAIVVSSSFVGTLQLKAACRMFCFPHIFIYTSQALPAVEYSSNLKKWRPALMVPDLVLLALIFFYISITIYDIVVVWRVERKATVVTKEDM